MSDYTLRVVSHSFAKWAAGAPSVAGGYIALDGPRIERIGKAEYDAMIDEAYGEHAHGDWVTELRSDCAEYVHSMPGGDRVRIAHDHYAGHGLVMRVPSDSGFARDGYAVPASLLPALTAALRDAGYDA